jgi:uncharacterized protein (UPF0297 family)
MKVYFSASKRGKSRFEDSYKRIYNHLEKLGYKNLDDAIIKLSTDELYISGNDDEGKKMEKFFSDALNKLRDADINIFECSEQSFSIGYLVQKSIELNKPTLVLYEESYQPSYFLLVAEEEKLITKSYNNETLEKVLEESLEAATQVADKRFNFFITPSLLTFLNQAARSQNITKSTLIRNLILDHRKKNSKS